MFFLEETHFRALTVGEIVFPTNRNINLESKIEREMMKGSTYVHMLPTTWIMESIYPLLEQMGTCTYVQDILSLLAL